MHAVEAAKADGRRTAPERVRAAADGQQRAGHDVLVVRVRELVDLVQTLVLYVATKLCDVGLAAAV